MKNILTLVALFFCCFPLFSQRQIHFDDVEMRTNGKEFYENSFIRIVMEEPPHKLRWKRIKISDTCSILKSYDGLQYYAGPEKEYWRYNGLNICRYGSGILKILTDTGRKYILGTWKRDFLSGDSLVKENDGNIYFCKWKLDKPVKNSQREATEEEKIQLHEKIESFEAIIEVSGI